MPNIVNDRLLHYAHAHLAIQTFHLKFKDSINVGLTSFHDNDNGKGYGGKSLPVCRSAFACVQAGVGGLSVGYRASLG